MLFRTEEGEGGASCSVTNAYVIHSYESQIYLWVCFSYGCKLSCTLKERYPTSYMQTKKLVGPFLLLVLAQVPVRNLGYFTILPGSCVDVIT